MSHMRIGYVRFAVAIGSPGRAGNNITMAKLRTKETTISTPRDSLMDEITVEGPFLVCRAFRDVQGAGRKRQVIAERFTPLTNVIDFELAPETDPGPDDHKQQKAGPTR